MVKIVVTQGLHFYQDQIDRLKSLGDVTFYDDLGKSPEEWLERCKGADIICTGKFGLKKKIYELKEVFISLPFVGIGWIDKEKIKARNITVAYSPGCNKDAVSEWIVAMILNLLRQLPHYIKNTDLPKGVIPDFEAGLTNKKITILGKGNVGSRVGKICEALGMKVSFFKRGDDLFESVKDADVVVDALSLNESTIRLLDKKFFNSMKKGSYFVTITSPKICDVDAMIEALDKGILAGAAHDSGGIQIGDVHDPFYKKLLNHPKILVTPHIAFNTDVTKRVSYDMMIDNIEAWLNKKPINLVE